MKLSEQLGMQYPIIQAPMAGVTTPEFVAASAEAGVLGSIGAGYFIGRRHAEVYSRRKKSYKEVVCGEFICSGKGEFE